MAMKFSQGAFTPKNLNKYVGSKLPFSRSSWEWVFMTFLDTNPSVLQWSSESVKIPYRDPLTDRPAIYIPDFLMIYVDKNMKKHVEIIEVKPENQTVLEKVGKNPYNQSQYVKNMAKWAAARDYCQQQGIVFRIINESDIFANTKGTRR